MRWLRAFPLSVPASLLALGCPGPVGAAGFQLFEQNGSGLGNAYAGQAAAAEDAGTIHFNPAGLTRLAGRQAVGALHLIAPNSKFNDGGSCAPYAGAGAGAGTASCPLGPAGNLGHPLGSEGGDAGDPSLVPNAYVSLELLPQRLWLGLGLNAPFGLKTEWDPDWAGRFHAVDSEVKTLNLNPTLAWKLDERISLGLGLNALRLSTRLGNAVSYRAAALASGVAPLAAATPPGAEGLVTVKGDDWGWGWNAGVLLTLSEATRLGVSYRSDIRLRVKGDVRFAGRPAALGAVPQLADGEVEARLRLPDMVSIALSHQIDPRLQLLADWTRTGWDSVRDVRIVRSGGPLAGQTLTSLPLRFRDSWRLGLGLNYRLDAAWKLRAGIAYDRSPVQQAFRTPRLPDADRLWIAGGAQWSFAPNAALDVGYAYVNARGAGSRLPNQERPGATPRGSLVGDYRSHVHVLSAQVRWDF